ncbi:UDP-N-acetylmuramoyl-tripeptide--D-alanyl-D-alanine ligase [Desulfoplanes sp.]
MRLQLMDIAAALNAIGDIPEDRLVRRVQTDSRLVEPGDLFVCIAGNNMDGHQFVAGAIRKGACGIVAHKPVDGGDNVPVLLVRDTLQALGRLAAYWRTKTGATVIGVTGSAGKTTLKEMLATILGLAGKTSKNFKNWNNQLGLPLSMLMCSGDERFWVMEVGISRPGDMDELAAILQPDCVLINNIGPCHLDGLGDISGVARAKATLVDFVTGDGTVAVSRDYPELECEVTKRADSPVFFSTRNPHARFFGHYQGPDKKGGGLFRLVLDNEEHVLSLPMLGMDMAEDCIGAACMAHCLGIDTATIFKGLEGFEPVAQRFCVSVQGGWTVIDDTYNANPMSMQRAIERAAVLGADQPLAMVLGEMMELGDFAPRAHRGLGEWVRATGCDLFFFSGPHAQDVREGFGPRGARMVELASPTDFRRQLDRFPPNGTILFKGSRSCRMEEYVRVFTEGRA